eukprot:m.29469 g.29469  ORF g.29469 m.29469 type:complete len:340 (+) comp9170_c1_seq1:299-1318(+)
MTITRMILGVFALALSVLAVPKVPLPMLDIDKDALTVSGISAGGAFAIQYHVAYSRNIHGAAIFAGPPYYCANADVEVALANCMKDPDLISVSELVAAVDYAAGLLSIDDPAYLKSSRVWIYTGQQDSVVVPGVMDKTHDFYKAFVPENSVMFVNDVPSEHAWVTGDYGSNCSFLGDPFINNCGVDEVGRFLTHIFNNTVQPKGKYNESSLLKFSQELYVLDGVPADISLGDDGYVYIPNKCRTSQCRLHISFHGCLQTLENIGETFVVHSGLNEYAETNSLVILYPQARLSPDIPYNPKGCFDWWGYTGLDYATQLGLQEQVVTRMVDALTGGSLQRK